MQDLIGTGEINAEHGLSRVQVFRLIKAGDWPTPVAELHDGRKVWRRKQIADHIAKLKKSGRLTEDMRVVPWRFLDKGNYARRKKLKEQLT